MNSLRLLVTFVAAAAAIFLAQPEARAQESFGPATMATVNRLVSILKDSCPVAKPDDAEAFASCQKTLFESAELSGLFAPAILWGGDKPGTPVWELPLTRFDSALFRSLYLPLFMFDGTYKLSHEGQTSWARLKLSAAFRNGLAVSEFPYPFWHDPAKWQAYQNANELVFRIDPASAQVWTMLRANDPEIATRFVAEKPAPAWDGKWTWTDDDRKFQPAVTLYAGLLDKDNPFAAVMSQTYKDFAISLRDKSCVSCHAPSNPRKMRPLVLLQTPAHAAAEIKSLIHAVEIGKMPLTEWGIADPLRPAEKEVFLAKAKAFESAAKSAFEWEKTKHAK